MLTLEKLLPREKLKGSPQKTPARVPSGKIWPHDEFSLGYRPGAVDGGQWHENPIRVSERAEKAISDDWALARFPVDLREVSNSTKPAKRGSKGITGYGRHMIKAVGALMNRQYPNHRVTFATVTIPPLPPELRRVVVDSWSDLTRELLRWLSRRAERAGVPRVVASVTEIQPKRLSEYGEGYLHWHLIWLNVPSKHGSWTVDPNELRYHVSRLLCRHCGVSPDAYVNVDVKRVKGAVARYMAKYMSKGSEMLAEAQEDWGEDATPSTWWNMTKPARDWVKDNTFSGIEAGEVIDALIQTAFRTGALDRFAYLRHVEIVHGDSAITVGWRGRLEPDDADVLRLLLKCD